MKIPFCYFVPLARILLKLQNSVFFCHKPYVDLLKLHVFLFCSGLHYFGQVISISDCVYRAMYRTRYLSSQDIDELIVPMKADTWADMLRNITTSAPRDTIASYNIRSAFFPTQHNEVPNDPNLSNNFLAVKYDILPLLKTFRSSEIYPNGVRSKVGIL